MTDVPYAVEEMPGTVPIQLADPDGASIDVAQHHH
jgi:hypothetical protein